MGGEGFQVSHISPEPNQDLRYDSFSVVLEWLKRKQREGVEKGWKDGGPGDV